MVVSPGSTNPKLLSESQLERSQIQTRVEQAAGAAWARACTLSERFFRDPEPPADLWEEAMRRTGTVLLEGSAPSIGDPELLLRNYGLLARKRAAARARHVPLDRDFPSPDSVENAVAARLDFSKIMESLDPEDRDLLMQRYIYDRSWVEIAAQKGQSSHASRKRCARLMEEIRSRLAVRNPRLGTRRNPK